MTSGSQQNPNRARGVAASLRLRKGKVAGSLIAISSAAIISIYTVGRTNSSAAFDRSTAGEIPAAAATAPASAAQPTSGAAATTYRDGTYTGTGNSRHGGMEVTVVVTDGKIASANVTSCGTRYPCSDINPLIRAAVSKQTVPTNHVSGATDSSKAYTQALTSALKQAKA